MRFITTVLLVSTTLTLVACAQKQKTREIGVTQFVDDETQKVVRGKEIQWKSCPPSLPKGCEMMIIDGNPKSSDLFTVRFKLTDELYMPAHTHPKDERVTVLSGEIAVGFGEEATKETAKKFTAGDHYINRRGYIHKVWGIKTGVIQITGIGPWEADFVDKK